MTPLEAMEAVAQAGVALALDPQGQIRATPAGRLRPEVRAAVRTHKDRLKAVLALREVHRMAGFSEADVLFIERALLSGQIREIRMAALPPQEPQ